MEYGSIFRVDRRIVLLEGEKCNDFEDSVANFNPAHQYHDYLTHTQPLRERENERLLTKVFDSEQIFIMRALKTNWIDISFHANRLRWII